jgi:3',5'-cyclic AMP phosphodiesterase CpdA
MVAELTTVADDLAVVHDGTTVHRFEGLAPDTSYEVAGLAVRTLARPAGQLLCRFVTVNDVHFGEVDCGILDDDDPTRGPVLRVDPGTEPHPELMNRAAVAEIAALAPDAVVVKGDLTLDGADHEYAAFLACYGVFGDRLHAVRGNHDRYHHQSYAAGDRVIDLPGVRIALMDTTIAGGTTGAFDPGQLEWLDSVAAESDTPVMAMGHHQDWTPATRRSDTYFGIHPDHSEALHEVMARRGILGWFAGHTHRNRVRRTPASNGAVHVEVGTVKDYPGSYAEYRVFEGGIVQVHHRVSSPEALAWSERCRVLYADFGTDYVTYALGRLEDRCFAISTR